MIWLNYIECCPKTSDKMVSGTKTFSSSFFIKIKTNIRKLFLMQYKYCSFLVFTVLYGKRNIVKMGWKVDTL